MSDATAIIGRLLTSREGVKASGGSSCVRGRSSATSRSDMNASSDGSGVLVPPVATGTRWAGRALGA